MSVIPKVMFPKSNLASLCSPALVQAFLAQVERDEHMRDLLEAMNNAYAFVTAAESLETLSSRPAVIESLAQQTTECAYFISDYAAQQSFGESICPLTLV